MVQLRLRLPVMPADIACPLCDGVADRFGDHSQCCPCGGDRVKRHNCLLSIVSSKAHIVLKKQERGLEGWVQHGQLARPVAELANSREQQAAVAAVATLGSSN